MEGIHIRQGTAKDIHSLFPFFKRSLVELFPEYTANTHAFFTEMRYSEANIRRSFNNDLIYLFVAQHNKTFIGYFLAYKPTGGVSMAIWIAVDPDYQKHGIASRLLELWEDAAKKGGAHALQLWTGDKNVPFYQRRGLKLVGKFPKAWYGIDINLLYKQIQEPKEKNYISEYFTEKSED